uniref:Uncharacterized protein n=1 Tax=Arundo donax TaxID=35708 RepID=A0A0A9A685_ARUDO
MSVIRLTINQKIEYYSENIKRKTRTPPQPPCM